MTKNVSIAASVFVFSSLAAWTGKAAEPDWSKDAPIPIEGRANPYAMSDDEFRRSIRAGRLYALHYPVEITGILLPHGAVSRLLSAESHDPLRQLLQRVARGLGRVKSFAELEAWLGFHTYPEREFTDDKVPGSPFFVPFKDGHRPDVRMGMTILETADGRGFTGSCAGCHSADLFGRRVLGMTNRFARANQFFSRGLAASKVVTPGLFQFSTGADEGEMRMYRRAERSMKFVEARPPIQLGLDTSLAHVALSLSLRARDPWASRDRVSAPRFDPLSRFPADSKPAVWWNVKYKNRWLSDGSVVSGNPIFTNILWNEIGRGTDLRELDRWLAANEATIRELTTAVFSSEAPRWTDFFSPESIDLAQARRGQALYNEHCAKCHGTYHKAWDLPDAHALSASERLATVRVEYRPKKPVFDVGTDPMRWQGMNSLAQLNDLAISQRHGIEVIPQRGYVPPPLVGIWARWPYFHNNSVPSLCAVLSPQAQRPVTYWARPANDPARDFDQDCNGYPLSGRPPGAIREHHYDTRREGMSNAGHDERILIRDGKEIFTREDKRALIRFLQTL